jgi:hypothetical protein
MFGGKPSPKKIARAVEAAERLLGGDTATAVDDRKLPFPRAQFKQLLLEEIGRLQANPPGSASIADLGRMRRYARCYVDLSAFQPRVDATGGSNSHLGRALQQGSVHSVMGFADRREFLEELNRVGYGSLY